MNKEKQKYGDNKVLYYLEKLGKRRLKGSSYQQANSYNKCIQEWIFWPQVCLNYLSFCKNVFLRGTVYLKYTFLLCQ